MYFIAYIEYKDGNYGDFNANCIERIAENAWIIKHWNMKYGKLMCEAEVILNVKIENRVDFNVYL